MEKFYSRYRHLKNLYMYSVYLGVSGYPLPLGWLREQWKYPGAGGGGGQNLNGPYLRLVQVLIDGLYMYSRFLPGTYTCL